MIRVSHLTKIYKSDGAETTALDDVTFEVATGEFLAIMGPSGSGKSTLMHILGALDSPTAGSYNLDGQELARLSDDELARIRNRKIGFVFQAFNLLPRTSALNNVTLPAVYTGTGAEERLARARELLEMVGLGNRINNLSNQLSGGQQQRVAIARALINDPAIILADEPTGNLASAQSREIMEIFTKLNTEGRTILMITHEPEIAQFAKRVITLRDGKITQDQQKSKSRTKGR